MKVLYDHQAFTYQDWGGVSKSFCELLLHRPSELEYKISIKESNNIHLRESGLTTGYSPISRKLQTFSKGHRFLGREKVYNLLDWFGILHTAEGTNRAESIKMLKQGDFDVFHPTFFDDYFLPYLNGKPYVLTVHDLMPELFGWWKGDSQIANKPKLLRNASAIIAVSNNTKKDLCSIYRIPEDKVHVVYHGYPLVNENIGHERIIPDSYILYVGGRSGYKNGIQTIKDFCEFNKIHPKVKFVFTGADFNKEEKAILESYGQTRNFISIFASDEQMASLYRHAIAFVFPSLYEGFGMPILEAFAYKCPVLLNNKSCFPEIGGDAAIYFNSQDGYSNLVHAMESVYCLSKEDRDGLISRGKERLEAFSWKESSEKLYNLYMRIL